ncbi:MAG: AsmA-like C-terminal domain-containing protein, partial [Candidatus Krumholzibacteriota bacterium]|nr:AsmA-like C-terminal domain-containing protein [Candidatus Krumholzibacteriota bacterium]
STESFVTAEAIQVNVKILPLLRKQVEIKRFVLERPVVTIIRDANGSFNYESLVSPSDTPAGAGGTGTGSSAAAVPFVLALADISDGTIFYKDRVEGVEYAVHKIDFTAENVALDSEITFEFHAAVAGDEQDVHVRGSVGPVASASPEDVNVAPVDITVEIGPVDAAALMAMAGGTASPEVDLQVSGSSTASFRVVRDSGVIEVTGSVDATPVAIEMGDVFAKPAGMPLLAVLRAGLTPAGDVDLKQLDITLQNTVVAITGTLAEQPELRITLNEADISNWSALIPALADAALGGAVAIDATVSGTKVNGSMVLKELRAAPEQLPSPVHGGEVVVRFTHATAEVTDATIFVGRSKIAAAATITRFTPLEADFRITASEIHRTDFQVPPQAPPRPEVLHAVEVSGHMRGLENGELESTAAFTSKKGVISNLDYTALSASIRSSADEVLIERFSMKTLDGTVEGSGVFHPEAKPPAFEVKTTVKQVNLAEYFRYKFPSLPRVIEGRVDGDLALGGSGSTWDEISPTLSGDGNALVLKGALLNVNLAREFIESVQSMPIVPAGFADKMRARNPDLFNSNETIFENLGGKLEIHDGRVEMDGLSLHSSDFDISGHGWFSFDRRVDMKTTFTLSRRLTQDIISELPAAQYLVDSNGRIAIPLNISGLATKPAVTVDTDALSRRLEDALVGQGAEELKDRLRGLLGGKKKN